MQSTSRLFHQAELSLDNLIVISTTKSAKELEAIIQKQTDEHLKRLEALSCIEIIEIRKQRTADPHFEEIRFRAMCTLRDIITAENGKRTLAKFMQDIDGKSEIERKDYISKQDYQTLAIIEQNQQLQTMNLNPNTITMPYAKQIAAQFKVPSSLINAALCEILKNNPKPNSLTPEEVGLSAECLNGVLAAAEQIKPEFEANYTIPKQNITTLSALINEQINLQRINMFRVNR
jgi:hypothetical protein